MHRLPTGKRTRLAELESKMDLAERHITMWLEALQTIRDEQLYLDQYDTFTEYCEKRWGKTRRRVNQLIAYAEVVSEIKDKVCPRMGNEFPVNGQAGEKIPLPTERQAAELAQLPEDQRGDAWEHAVDAAGGQSPSLGQVRHSVESKKAEAGAEAETIDQKGQVVDAEGTPVPEGALPAFETAKQIVAVCRQMDGLIRCVEEIAKGPGGRLIHFDSFKQQVKDAKGNIYANRATHVCPYCKGKGGACKPCKGEGWTAKHVWAQAPHK